MESVEVAERLALRQLVERYSLAVDDRDYPAFAAIFTEDGVLIPPGFELVGPAQIAGAMQAIEQYSATLHAVHNHYVELAGDAPWQEATGELYCIAAHLFEEDGRALKLDMGIRYQDRYRRVDGAWRIARRELRVVWEQTLPLTPDPRPA